MTSPGLRGRERGLEARDVAHGLGVCVCRLGARHGPRRGHDRKRLIHRAVGVDRVKLDFVKRGRFQVEDRSRKLRGHGSPAHHLGVHAKERQGVVPRIRRTRAVADRDGSVCIVVTGHQKLHAEGRQRGRVHVEGPWVQDVVRARGRCGENGPEQDVPADERREASCLHEVIIAASRALRQHRIAAKRATMWAP